MSAILHAQKKVEKYNLKELHSCLFACLYASSFVKFDEGLLKIVTCKVVISCNYIKQRGIF
jgi:hypothetical protein